MTPRHKPPTGMRRLAKPLFGAMLVLATVFAPIGTMVHEVRVSTVTPSR